MFGKIGLPELILILVIALIIFGPRKLPDIGRSIGKGIREFRQATTEISKTVSLDDDEEEIMEGSKKIIETKETKESSSLNESANETEQSVPDSEAEVVDGVVEDNSTSATEQDEPETLKTGSDEEAKH